MPLPLEKYHIIKDAEILLDNILDCILSGSTQRAASAEINSIRLLCDLQTLTTTQTQHVHRLLSSEVRCF